jgi:hypothetical protein
MSTENIQMSVNEQATSTETTRIAPNQTLEQQVNVNTLVSVPLFQLLNLRNIIDVSTSRGAFKSNELSSVGKVYDELSTIINTLVQEVKNNQTNTQTSEEPSAEPSAE